MIEPDFATFPKLARQGNLVPVYENFHRRPADAGRRLSAPGAPRALRLPARKRRGRRKNRPLHLHRRQSRRSLSLRQRRLRARRREPRLLDAIQSRSISCAIAWSATGPCAFPGLPPLVAGAIGYFSYDMVRLFERIPDNTRNDLRMDDARDDVLSGPGRLRPRPPPRLDRAQRLHRRRRQPAREIQRRRARNSRNAPAARRAAATATTPRAKRAPRPLRVTSNFTRRAISRRGAQIQGVHPRRRYFPGGRQPALFRAHRRRPVRDLSRPARASIPRPTCIF